MELMLLFWKDGDIMSNKLFIRFTYHLFREDFRNFRSAK